MKKYENLFTALPNRRKKILYNKFPIFDKYAAKTIKANYSNLPTIAGSKKALRIDPSSNGPTIRISKMNKLVNKSKVILNFTFLKNLKYH